MKNIRDVFRRIGIQTSQDFIYFLGMALVTAYLMLILGVSVGQIFNSRLVLQEEFVLFHSNWQFPALMIACIAVMLGVLIDWLIVGIVARIFKRKQNHSYSLDFFESLYVSIIIPAHNEEKVITNLINDLFLQTYKNLEIIVIAHNCTDRTIERVQEVQQKSSKIIKLIDYKTRRSGKALALNKGLQVARGSIIAHFDADNRIPDEKFITKIVQYFRKDLATSGVQCTLGIANHRDDLLTLFQRIEWKAFINIFWKGRKTLKLPSFFAGTGTAIRAAILRKYGGWNERSLVEDLELFTRLSFAEEKIIYADDLLVLDEKPTTWSALIQQRARWLKGGLLLGIRYMNHFDNIVDYLYRLFPLSIFAWLVTNALYIFYFLTGQVSLVNLSKAVWIGWALIMLLLISLSLVDHWKWKVILIVPLYWLFTYHLIFVALDSLFLNHWSHTTHFGEGV